jgi:hypothetical protein
MKDIAIMQLIKQPTVVDPTTGLLQTNNYQVLRQMGQTPKAVTGINKLAQFLTKLLMTTLGSDQFDPNYGSSLLFILKQGQSLEDIQDLQSQIATHIADVQKQIIAGQTNLQLPPDERLASLNLQGVTIDDETLEISISLSMVSEAGTSRVVNLDQVVTDTEDTGGST